MSNLPLPSSIDDPDFYEENRWQKFSRRLKEEPLVPLGCALTCYALYGASKAMRRGDSHTVNRFFRYRIYAQGFTLVAVVAGSIYYKQDREKRKKYQGLVAEKVAEEKKQAWIRELEARDEEDKLARARRQDIRDQSEKKAMMKGIREAASDKEKDASVRRDASRAAAADGGVDITPEQERRKSGFIDSVQDIIGGGGNSSGK
ncbi:MAG: hypothetical protein M1825_005182 [Sarcosagium campestre]|nr:MAG: hypothetical protein M1825_005182 [Sarcosagium campestre]